MLHTLLFISASVSIGYVLYLIFYWRQMHAFVPLTEGMMDGVHILIILALVGLVLSLF